MHVLTKSAAGTWSQPATLTGPAGEPNGFEPRLDVAPNGSAVIGYQLPAGGVVVVRKPANHTWAQTRVKKFAENDFTIGVATGRDGRVIVTGDRQLRGGQSVVIVHVFRPGVGWLTRRDLGREGVLTELFVDVGRNGSTAVAWTVGTKDFRHSAVAVRRMSAHYRWDKTKLISPWFGPSHTALVSDVSVGPRGTVTVTWSGRTAKASTRLPSGVWVRRPPVPNGATLQFASYSTTFAGDAAVPWYTTNLVDGFLSSENLYVSVRDYPSLTWRRSETLGTSSCGTGERGDPGCRPFAVSTLPGGSTLVSWFDLTNALVARLVH